MSGEWPEVVLDDHVDLVTGFPFKSALFVDTDEEAIKLLRGDNVAQGVLRWGGAKYWPSKDASEYQQFELEERDVILAMDRPWIEAGLKYAWVRESDLPCLLVQRVARMRGINGLTTDYLRYVIGSPSFTAHVKSITTGVNVPHISGKDIKRYRFALPPIIEQRRITSILGVYDDLTEINNKRIAMLEEMARRLFEEWFVHFRFPDYNCSGEAASMPNGWVVTPIRELGKVVTGKTPGKSNANYYGGTIQFLKIPDMRDCNYILSTEDHLSSEGAASQPSKMIPPGSLCVSCIGTIGLVAITTEPCHTNQQINSLIPKHEYLREFLFFCLRMKKAALENLGSTGATMGNVNKNKFEGLTLSLPSDDFLKRYHRLAAPMFSAMMNYARANTGLGASRNLLLPRLISGDLSVSTAERELEAVA
jgi:type I restriction enzyme S subunit